MSEPAPAAEQTAPQASSDSPAPTATDALGWVGSKLEEITGLTVGRVEGVYVDSDSGEPCWLLVRIGRFRHRSLVPFEHAVEAAGRVWIPYGRDHLRASPKVDPEKGLSREQELTLCAYYEIPETVGRAARVTTRRAGESTARPV